MECTLVNIKCMASSWPMAIVSGFGLQHTHPSKSVLIAHANADFIPLGESYQIIGCWPMEI